MVNIGNSWDEVLREEFEKDYYLKLRQFLIAEYRSGTVYPDMHDIFNALKAVPYEGVRAVILGQDPYHEPGQAHGMAFSVQPGVPQPPSLVNIFKELRDDLGIDPPPKNYGYLMDWARQGVLLLNTCLTVRAHRANSHKGKGWEIFTDSVIRRLAERETPLVFILWGGNARSKKSLILEAGGGRFAATGAGEPGGGLHDAAGAGEPGGCRHLILEGAHPSPLSAYNGFFGGAYFSRANEFLAANGEGEIDWEIKVKE